MEKQGPPIMFRLKPWLVEILKEKGKGNLSINLIAKNCVMDHLINLNLIPKTLIPQLLRDATLDYFTEIQRAYNFTDSEMQELFKKMEEKNA